MTLPKAIQRELDQAALIEQSLQQAPEPTVVEEVNLPPPVAESTPQVAPPPPAPPAPPAENWEAKYKSLQGLFAQKTAELKAQTAAQASEMAQLKKQMAELMEHKERKPETPQVDPKDVENFGADMIEMVQRYADRKIQTLAATYAQKVTALDTRITEIEKLVNGVSQKTDATLEQQYYAHLSAAVPDWEAINSDERWLRWLAEVDPVMGAPRQAALERAQETLNVQHTVAVFRAFKDSLPKPAPVQSLSAQVAPSSAASAPPAPSQQGAPKIYTVKAVERFYKELASGKYLGREAEALAMEAELDRAVSEGRVRG